MRDRQGVEVPDKLLGVFMHADSLLGAEDAAIQMGKRLRFFLDTIPEDLIKPDVRKGLQAGLLNTAKLANRLRQAVPWTVCSVCKGSGKTKRGDECRACQGRGFHTAPKREAN